MSHAPIMPFYTDAYLADTHHLNAECQGAYLLLLLHTWRNNGTPPPNDDRILARIARVPLVRWRKQVRPQLETFFQHDDGHWRQKRLEKEWARACDKIEQQRHKAMKSNWVQNQRKQLTTLNSPAATAPATRTPSINHEPNSNPNSIPPMPNAQSTMPRATPALTALKPILNDVRYFVRDGLRLSPCLMPQVHEAIKEIESLLQPMSTDEATTQLQQLDAHFPKRNPVAEHAARLHDYLHEWLSWPADIGAAVVASLIATHPYPSLPPLATCIAKATPLLSLRRAHHTKLQRLLTS